MEAAVTVNKSQAQAFILLLQHRTVSNAPPI